MSGTFMPAASSFEASGDTQSLLALYRHGTRAMMLVSLPVLITLMVRGSSFIGLWMGAQYRHSSGIVLLILAFPLIFSFANQTATAIAFGTEKHKTMAWWSIGEGIANLVLSVTLVHFYGIYGVAIGTLIPSLIAQLGFWPRYVSKLVGVTWFEVIWGVWRPIVVVSLPFVLASWLMMHRCTLSGAFTGAVHVAGHIDAPGLPDTGRHPIQELPTRARPSDDQTALRARCVMEPWES